MHYLRRMLAREAVAERGVSIRLACETYGISETCCRYQPLRSDENADWRVRLTANQRNCGFGLGADVRHPA